MLTLFDTNFMTFSHTIHDKKLDTWKLPVMSHIYYNLLKVTGHPFWRFVENRYCALKISPIFIKFSPNVRQCM